MKIGRYFRWSMGHRLIYHEGKCKNLHGHNYKAYIEVEGELNENGMVIDFADLKKEVNQVLDSIDHCFMCYDKDNIMKEFLVNTDFKVVYVPFETTSENICLWLKGELINIGLNVSKVKVWETEDLVAENE